MLECQLSISTVNRQLSIERVDVVDAVKLTRVDVIDGKVDAKVDGEMSGRQLQDRLKLYNYPDNREPLGIVKAISWAAREGVEHPNLANLGWRQLLRIGERTRSGDAE